MGYREVREVCEQGILVVEDETIPDSLKLSTLVAIVGKIRWMVRERGLEVVRFPQEEIWPEVNEEERHAEF